MESLILLIPIAMLLVGIAVAALFWAVGNGQFDDLDRAAHDILFDDTPAATGATATPEQAPADTPPAPCNETPPRP